MKTMNPIPAAVRAIGAYAKHRNTPESDRCPVVEIILTLSDGTQVEVWATDPFAAINEYNRSL